jgi:hypothetical protein
VRGAGQSRIVRPGDRNEGAFYRRDRIAGTEERRLTYCAGSGDSRRAPFDEFTPFHTFHVPAAFIVIVSVG